MSQWYFFDTQTKQRTGPFDEAVAIGIAQSNPAYLCWREGMGEWRPVREVGEFNAASIPPPPNAPPPNPGSGNARMRADDIEFRIVGNDMQFVEVELDPGESAVAEAGALMFKDASVRMDTVFGDGSAQNNGLMDKLFAAGRRVLAGDSLFTTVFTHQGTGKAKVAFASPYPGTVLAMKLDEHGGRLICQKDSFLAGARGVSLGIFFQRKILTGLFGGDGFIMQKLEGDGWVFVHAGGTVVERELAAGERLDVDTGCVVAFHDTVGMDVRPVSGIKSMFFGGEGMFLATLTGPGKVWIQSLPFSRLAARMWMSAPQAGGRNVGEGSVLGSLGRIIDGDNNF